MTNNFSIKVSERLRELGVEGETEHYWVERTYPPGLTGPNPTIGFISAQNLNRNPYHEVSDKILEIGYQLHDILRLMPEIGERMGWTLMQKVSSRMEICTAFFNDDYEGAEQYLLGILKQ